MATGLRGQLVQVWPRSPLFGLSFFKLTEASRRSSVLFPKTLRSRRLPALPSTAVCRILTGRELNQ
jgi:hypothetical protein